MVSHHHFLERSWIHGVMHPPRVHGFSIFYFFGPKGKALGVWPQDWIEARIGGELELRDNPCLGTKKVKQQKLVGNFHPELFASKILPPLLNGWFFGGQTPRNFHPGWPKPPHRTLIVSPLRRGQVEVVRGGVLAWNESNLFELRILGIG